MKRDSEEEKKRRGKIEQGEGDKDDLTMLGANKKVLRSHWCKAYIARRCFLLFHLTLPGSYYGFVHVIYSFFLTHYWTDTHTPLINSTDVMSFSFAVPLYCLLWYFYFSR